LEVSHPLQLDKEPVLVSYLITVFNGEKFISKTISSILKQEYKHLEVIVVDDGSNDNSLAVLQKFATLDQRIKIYSPGRLGRAKSLNFGLSKCTGKYIAVNDADDFSKPDRIAKQVEFMESHPGVGLLGTAKEIHEEDGRVWIDRVPMQNVEIRRFFLKGQPIQHSSVMFRRDILEKAGGYNENIPFLLDRDIFLRVGKISNMHQLPEPLIILNRSPRQYFRNRYTGLERVKLGTYYQLKAVDDFGFSPLRKLPILAKFAWSFILEFKNRIFTTK
jgi:glycosyltransferase involved in cell wall biosynthesis